MWNYGYNPVDSSDEEPLSETEEKKAKLELADGGRSTPTTPTTRRPTAPSGVKQNSPIGVKPATPSGVKSTAAGNVDRPLEGRRERRVAPPTAKESPVTPREERKENVRKEEVEEKKKTPGWKLKKRKCYVERDEDFQPASKDFKVDLSLERQARKRKEKKIFDPSALDSKGTRRGRNGLKGSGQDVKDSTTATAVGGKKMISPVKKFSSGASAKVSPPVVQVPPGGRTNITPLVPSTVCYLCQTYGKRIKGVPEKLICCVKCSVSKVHISCLNDARLPTEKAISTSSSVPHTWSCRKCNLHCVYCNQNKPGVSILECIECKSGFHIPCHWSLIPPPCKTLPGVSILECIECKSGFHIPCHWSLIPPPCKTLVLTPTTFKCVRCVPPLQQASQIVEKPPEKPPAPEVKPKPSAVAPAPAAPSVGAGGDSAPPKVMVTNLKPKVNSMAAQIGDSGTAPTDTRPPLTPSGLRIPGVVKLEDPYADIPIDESIPDCRSWTALEVYNYMRLYLQPHEIDGSALLLLKRSDCIQILGLPLGFGLKLWSHVKRLQTKRSEIEIYWE
ncbi:hypothetical protein M8J75_003005 [Diaphorina citri]|nr:hypothetical protein M8J75_003005 [Diaphorina citri]